MSVKILAQTETSIKFREARGEVTLPRDIFRLIEPGKGLGGQFQAKLKEAGGKPGALPALLAWCKDGKLKLEGDFTSCLILAKDPANPDARAFLGLKQPF